MWDWEKLFSSTQNHLILSLAFQNIMLQVIKQSTFLVAMLPFIW